MKKHKKDAGPHALKACIVALGGCGWGALCVAAEPVQIAAAPAEGTVAVEFNANFLKGSTAQTADLKRFAFGNPVQPGNYLAEVYLNGRWLGKLNIQILPGEAKLLDAVCLDRNLAQRLNLDVARVSDKVKTLILANNADTAQPQPCLRFSDIDSAASASFDPSELRLDVSVPQALIARSARGYVPPEAWDEGVRAASLEYRLSSYRSSTDDATTGDRRSTTSSFLGLTARANIGWGWQITHNGSLSWGTDQSRHYQSLGTYARHDIPSWKSNVTLGDDYTDGQLFDSVGFRGVKLASDDRMLPDSQRGYAPVIRGTARGNATVSVKQNGTLLTEVVVPPGPFEINDLYPTGFGGNLQVTVTESDGSQQNFVVAYTAGPQLLREDQLRYSLVGGQVVVNGTSSRPGFALGTAQYGFNNSITGNAGFTLMSGYGSVLLGGAVNTPVGAIGLNVSGSQLTPDNASTLSGFSYNATYTVVVPTLRTNVTFAAYRYNTANYYSLRDAAALLSNTSQAPADRERNRAVASVTQLINDRASVQLSGIYQGYWTRSGHDLNYQLTLNYKILDAQLSLGLGRSSSPTMQGTSASRVSLDLSLPLGKEYGGVNLSASAQHYSGSGTTTQLNASGSYGEQSEYGYGVSLIRDATDKTTAAVNGSWRGSKATVFGTASTSRGSNQASVSVSGGLVAHAGGVTLAQAVGETIAIIEAKDAAGAQVVNNAGIKLDGSGYAVVPYLTPYKENEIGLDLRNVPLDVELESTADQVAPHAGAVVSVKFKGRTARAALISTSLSDGGALPLGATVADESGLVVGMVGQGGLAEVRVNSDQGKLTVSWGDDGAKKCFITYKLAPRASGEGFARVEANCRPADGSEGPDKLAVTTVSSLQPQTGAQETSGPVNAPAAGRRSVVLSAVTSDGRPVPAGAEVVDESGEARTAVAANGRIFMRLPVARNLLSVRWGAGEAQRCSISFDVPMKTRATEDSDAPVATCTAT